MKSLLFIFFLLYGVITCAMELTNIPKEILSKITACNEPCDRNNCMKVNKYLHDCFSIKNHEIVAHSPLKLGLKDQIFFMLYYCDEGKEETVKNLLNNGALANTSSKTLNISALSIALQNKHYKVAELLQKCGAKNDQLSLVSSLCMAAYKGDLERVKWYCENKLYDDNSLKVNGIPLLCIAALRQTAIVEFLLTYFKSNPSKLIYKEDGQDNCGNLFLGRSALHFAAEHGNVSSMQLLLNSGVINIDIDNRDCNDCTPLHYAVSKGQLKAMQFLIEHGAYIDAKDKEEWASLHYAAYFKQPIDLIVLLLEKGADINTLNITKQTPLHIAAIHKNNAAIKLLIACGAQKDIRDNKGKLAVEYAAEHPELNDCIELLSCEPEAQLDPYLYIPFFESTKKWFGFF